MYHRIVAGRVRSTFAAINAGDREPMIAGMAPQFTYRFYGDHALGGERHTAAALRMRWHRVDELLPSLLFHVDEVLVSGWPWATRVAVRLTVDVGLADDTHYQNIVMQFLGLRWGKITLIRTLEDTQLLSSVLDRLGSQGITQALAPPITDADAA